VKQVKDLRWIQEHDIAHRGYYTKDQSIPENSISAFRRAIEHGYSIELDINVTQDGTVVSFHDHTLDRICGDSRSLSEVNYDEIRHLTLFQSKEHIPSLQEVLDTVSGKVPLLIELKPKGDVKLLCESFVEVMKDYQGAYAIFSFHPKVVYWFKKNHPEVIRGQIAEFFKRDSIHCIFKYLLKTMFFNRFTKPDFISYGIYDMPNRYLDQLMKKGMTIISYAAKSQEDLDRIRSLYHNAVFEHFEPQPRKNEY
jgi:glycerophosphoryl diester phosphodiesterase